MTTTTRPEPKPDFNASVRDWGLTWVGHELRYVHKPVTFTNNLPTKTRDKIKACSTIGLSYWADHPGKACVWATDFHQRWHVVKIDYKNREVEHYCGKGDALGYAHGSDKCPETGRREGFFICEKLDIAALELAIPTLDDMEQHEELSRIWHSTPTFFNPDEWQPPKEEPMPTATKPRAPRKKVTAQENAKASAELTTLLKKEAARAAVQAEALRKATEPTNRPLNVICSIINFDPDYLDDLGNEELVLAVGHTTHDDKINAELATRNIYPAEESA